MSSSLLSRSATDNELYGVSLRRVGGERRSGRSESFGYGPVSPGRHSGEMRESKSFWDRGDVESAVSLTTADEENWVRTQVSRYFAERGLSYSACSRIIFRALELKLVRVQCTIIAGAPTYVQFHNMCNTAYINCSDTA